MESMSNVAAIKKFFGEGEHSRPVTMDELKKLSAEERQSLGDMCRAALNE